jgi:nitrile hydratase beta subunit
MNGIHDMGGMHGFGPVDVSDDAEFHAEWERRARAMANLVYLGDFVNLDAFRAAMEVIPPADYLQSSYFERWLKGIEAGLIERGYLTRQELDARLGEIAAGTYEPSDPAQRRSPDPPNSEPEIDKVVQRFEVGDTVRVRNVHEPGHNRSPHYLRGKVGVIQACRGHEIFPDTNSRYLGDRPQVVYSVTFEGRALWGASAELGQLLSIDLWDSYLEPA